MKKVILLVMVLASTSVFAKKKPKIEPIVPVNMNELKMNIVSKSCDGVKIELNGNESIQTGSSQLMFISQVSENDSQVCKQAQGYFRMTVGSGTTTELQAEYNELYKGAKRTVCRSKATQEILSDVTEQSGSLSALAVLAEFNFTKALKTLTLKGDSQCLQGKLVLELADQAK